MFRFGTQICAVFTSAKSNAVQISKSPVPDCAIPYNLITACNRAVTKYPVPNLIEGGFISDHPLTTHTMPWTHRSFWLGPLIIAVILSSLVYLFSHGRLHAIYKERFKESRRERLFLGCFGFFVTVLVVRGITLAIHYDVGPFHNVSMHGRHIHHMVWGILLLLIVGYCWLIEVGTGSADSWPLAGRITALLYGVAAALILDEFALWLNLQDVYWQRQGRESYEAMALFGSFLAVGLLGGPLFRGLFRELTGPFRKA